MADCVFSLPRPKAAQKRTMGLSSSSSRSKATLGPTTLRVRGLRELELFGDGFGHLAPNLSGPLRVVQDVEEPLEGVGGQMRGHVSEGQRPGGHLRTVAIAPLDQFEQLAHERICQTGRYQGLGPFNRFGRGSQWLSRHAPDVRAPSTTDADEIRLDPTGYGTFRNPKSRLLSLVDPPSPVGEALGHDLR